MVGAFLVGAIALSGCAKTATVAATRKEPFKVEKVEGTERKRIRLEAKAAERLGLQTATVTEVPASAGGPVRKTVPYGALIYDTKGGVSVYTVPEPLLYIREAVKVQSIDGDVVVLSEGPPPGMAVVTAGGSELTGIEFGVGK
jgi:multidrug efflux pump subunit AcrA (membrane-fusion protein)